MKNIPWSMIRKSGNRCSLASNAKGICAEINPFAREHACCFLGLFDVPPVAPMPVHAGGREELKRPPGNIQRPPGLKIACFRKCPSATVYARLALVSVGGESKLLW